MYGGGVIIMEHSKLFFYWQPPALQLCQGWSSSMGNSYGWDNEKDKLTTGKW